MQGQHELDSALREKYVSVLDLVAIYNGNKCSKETK